MKKRGSRKGCRSRFLIAVLVALVVACAALCAVCRFAFRTFVLVSDTAWSYVLPQRDVLSLRVHLAFKGVRLKVVELDEYAVSDISVFLDSIVSESCDYVLLSPIAFACARRSGIDLSAFMPEARVGSIGTRSDASLSDLVLVSDERSGWLDACRLFASRTESMSRNVALVCESGAVSYAEDIVSCFPVNGVSVFTHSGSSKLFYPETLRAMDEQGIVIALCPYVENLSSFFDQDYGSGGSVKWVVDYRFENVLPSSSVYGVVAPDLVSAAEAVMGCSKKEAGSSGSLMDLEYRYEKR